MFARLRDGMRDLHQIYSNQWELVTMMYLDHGQDKAYPLRIIMFLEMIC